MGGIFSKCESKADNQAINEIFSRPGVVTAKDQNDNTPLHTAVEEGNVDIIKALILFGADLHAINCNKETPADIALRSTHVNKNLIVELLKSVGGLPLTEEEIKISFDDKLTLSEKKSSTENRQIDGAKVLCLDGGVKGVVTTLILMELEKKTGRLTKDLFDWIGGTSLGGILTLALARGYSAVEVQALYFKLKKGVLESKKKDLFEPLEKVVKDAYGEHATMSDMKDGCKVVLQTILAEEKPAKLKIFRNYDHPAHTSSENIEKASTEKASAQSQDSIEYNASNSMEIPIWKVARDAGAAAAHLHPMYEYLGGTMLSSNPTLDVLAEIQGYNTALEKEDRTDEAKRPGLVVSIGTGMMSSEMFESMDSKWMVKIGSHLDQRMSMGLNLFQVFMDSSVVCEDYVTHPAKAWCQSLGSDYFRLNPRIEKTFDLEHMTDKNLIDVMWSTKVYLHQNSHVIQHIADLLT